MTPEERRRRAQIAANTRWAFEDGKVGTAKARATRREQLEDQVDPDRALSADERRRRVDRLVRAHMLRMAHASAKARSKRGAA